MMSISKHCVFLFANSFEKIVDFILTVSIDVKYLNIEFPDNYKITVTMINITISKGSI